MNSTIQSAAAVLVLAGALALGAGCASQSYQKGTKTAEAIDQTAERISALSTQIDSVLGNLKNLVETPAADLRPQYKALASSLSSLKSASEKLASDRVAMGQKGKAFFASWDQKLAQINNPEIKAKAQSRREEVTKQFEAIRLSYTEVEVASKPFITDLRDIDRYLSIDLTPGGIAAIKDQVAKAAKEAGPVKDGLAKLSQQFRDLGAAMSAVTEAAAPSTPGEK